MPVLTHEKAIKEYWNEVKDKYPNLDFNKFAEICKTPFRFIKFCIRQDEIFIIAIKFFGKFKVYPSRLKKLIAKNEFQFSREYISEEQYLETKERRLRQLKEIEDDRQN